MEPRRNASSKGSAPAACAFLRAVAIRHDRLQASTIGGTYLDLDPLMQGASLLRLQRQGTLLLDLINQPLASEQDLEHVDLAEAVAGDGEPAVRRDGATKELRISC
jgi:hypothetical protein